MKFANKARLGLVLVLFNGACDRSEEPPPAPAGLTIEFGRGQVMLVSDGDTVRMEVDVAQSDAQRNRGLMQRSSLGPNEGMIFLFDEVQPPEGTFWMYNTLIPLSIAFIGEDGRIGSIVQMEPCESPYAQWCPEYPAGVPFKTALEANPDFFESNGIGIGDEVVFDG